MAEIAVPDPACRYLDQPVRRTVMPPLRLQAVIDDLGSGQRGTLISGRRAGLPESLSLAYRAMRWLSDGDLPAEDELQFRELAACLFDAGRPIGAMIFHEARFSAFVDRRDLLMSFDDYSFEWLCVSQVLLRHWSTEDFLEASEGWFHVVEFSALWVHPKARQNVWNIPTLRLIQQRYRSRAHLMLLKPFPLEYEGAGEARGLAEQARVRRIRAMVRLYQRSLGATLLEDPDRDEPWMYVPMCSSLPGPSIYDIEEL